VAVVAVIAAANAAAARREHRQARNAADRVEATLVAAGGEVRDHEFDMTLLVTNRGGPITVRAGRRVAPAVFDAQAWEDRFVESGTTEQLTVPFTARCPVPPEERDRRLSLVVPIAPASGRVRDVAIYINEHLLWDLSRRACNFDPLIDGAAPLVGDVAATRYGVTFTLSLTNHSDRPLDIVNLTSPGLALSVRGGVPVVVPPYGAAQLAVTVALPACSRLPTGPGYGAIALEVRGENGGLQNQPVTGGSDDLRFALGQLRTRICPRS
jgi:hypothetical protein